jgi:hypothetical protein
MYEVFDPYLKTDTWHTSHPLDDQRFFRALNEVVKNPNFNPDEMGRYMREQKKVSRDDNTNPFNSVIDDRVSNAWAVKEFLEANGL